MVLKRAVLVFLPLLAILVIVAGCAVESPGALELPDGDQLNPTSTPLPTPAPQRVLSVCLGEEPRSLFLYGDQSTSARIIRQAIFDSPVDLVNSQDIPILLAEMPSQENGLVNVTPVEVFPGDRMVDAKGNITFLAGGVEYRPAGCASQDCWETFAQGASIELDQVKINYKLRTGILWSDGLPVTPLDSLFSFHTSSLIYGSAGPTMLRYTASYEVGEEEDLIWKGLPGYLGVYSYADFFFPPLPSHRLNNFTREEFLTSPQTNLQPLGWGAYQVQEWVAGDHITLIANPNYHDADEGLPGFDALVFRFVESGEEALAALRAGESQIIANEPDLLNLQRELLVDQEEGGLQIYTVEGTAWEQVSLGIDSLGKKQTLLGDPELRQVLVSCIDRERISQSRLDAGEVVDDFTLPIDSNIQSDDPILTYQPAESGLKLMEMGWVDQDGDPETPRQAEGIEGISDGTPLQFTLLAANSQSKSITLDYIQQGLNNCGVGIEIQTLPGSELLSSGPEGPVFGRDFDLAYFAWAAGRYQPCRLFISDEIPGIYPESPKGWGGVNATGYSSQEYDQACLVLTTNLPDSQLALEASAELKDIFRAEMPALPLFFRRELIIADPGISGLESGFFDQFWNIEVLQ